jgi:hypothetical protein
MWSQATVNKHFGYNVMGNQLMSVAPLMESPMFEDSAQEVDKFDASTSDIAASTFCYSMPQEARFETRALNPQAAHMAQVIELQILLNKSQMLIEAQGEIMKTLFGSLTEQPHRTEVRLFDYIHLSLGRLLSLAGPDWNGDLDGFQVLTS